MKFGALTRFAWLSIGAAVVTMALKLFAWRLTGSVGLLSDALESLVNLGGAAMLLVMLHLAAQPPDEGHPHGHSKAEYFASGFEGLLILVAGGLILAPAIARLVTPQALHQTSAGLMVSAAATVINLVVSRILSGAGRRHRSPALDADARHLMTDVWTSVAVIGGVGLVAVSGWLILDPLIAIAVALHILWTGVALSREAFSGLMDAAWPASEKQILDEIMQSFRSADIQFHAVRTRRSAARRFVSLHVLVPGYWTVQQGHDLLESIEAAIVQRLHNVDVLTHLEPLEDPASYDDLGLDRKAPTLAKPPAGH